MRYLKESKKQEKEFTKNNRHISGKVFILLCLVTGGEDFFNIYHVPFIIHRVLYA